MKHPLTNSITCCIQPDSEYNITYLVNVKVSFCVEEPPGGGFLHPPQGIEV